MEAASVIADPQVRYLGTIGGNVANGDPGNDMPAVMMCLGATYQLSGKGGERRVAARDFYQGAYFTALEPGEILAAIRIPVPPPGHGYAYEKLKRKIGDYATAAAAVVLTMAEGRVTTCSIGLTNVGETPLWAEEAARHSRRIEPRRRDRQARGRRGRGDHVAGVRHARPGRVPHEDGRRDADPRPRTRPIARPLIRRDRCPKRTYR